MSLVVTALVPNKHWRLQEVTDPGQERVRHKLFLHFSFCTDQTRYNMFINKLHRGSGRWILLPLHQARLAVSHCCYKCSIKT